MIQGKGVDLHAHEAWKKFIDGLEANNADVYLNLWMRTNEKDPKIIGDNYQKWRHLVQGAFLEGYEAGFTDRLFKGEK
jgi:hypothetical protein